MLQVDLDRLERKRRLRIDGAVAVGDPRWDDTGIRPARLLALELDVSVAGAGVLARGRIEGEAVSECRRCLKEVRVPLDEIVTLLYRAGADVVEAESEQAYPLPEQGRELDLWPAIREHVILAVPDYALCRDACPGLCGRCGAYLEAGPCGCGEPEPDERWAALRELKR